MTLVLWHCGGDDSSSGTTGTAGTATTGSSGASSTGASGSTATGGTTGTGGTGGEVDAGNCPATKPDNGSSCDVEEDCLYGLDACTCVDPPAGHWLCAGGAMDGGNPSECPAQSPLGLGCPDASMSLDCRYPSEGLECTCNPGDTDWSCVQARH